MKKENFDRNGDGRIDVKEWTFIEAYLEQNFKGHYRVNKRFTVKSDVHAVASKPVSCEQCHVDRNVFGKARLKRIGPVAYDLSVDVDPVCAGNSLHSPLSADGARKERRGLCRLPHRKGEGERRYLYQPATRRSLRSISTRRTAQRTRHAAQTVTIHTA